MHLRMATEARTHKARKRLPCRTWLLTMRYAGPPLHGAPFQNGDTSPNLASLVHPSGRGWHSLQCGATRCQRSHWRPLGRTFRWTHGPSWARIIWSRCHRLRQRLQQRLPPVRSLRLARPRSLSARRKLLATRRPRGQRRSREADALSNHNCHHRRQRLPQRLPPVRSLRLARPRSLSARRKLLATRRPRGQRRSREADALSNHNCHHRRQRLPLRLPPVRLLRHRPRLPSPLSARRMLLATRRPREPHARGAPGSPCSGWRGSQFILRSTVSWSRRTTTPASMSIVRPSTTAEAYRA